MKEEDFIKRVLTQDSITISNNAIESRQHYQEIAELTEYIDYGCKIVPGVDRCSHNEMISEGCCCRGCQNVIGYRITMSQNEIPILAKYFNKDTGYWREGIGCILPRKHRSITCLSHKCKNLGIFSTLVLDMLSRMKEGHYPIISPHDFIWKEFVKALKKENGYKKPIKINK